VSREKRYTVDELSGSLSYEMVFVGNRRDSNASGHEEKHHLRQQTDLL